MVTGSSPAANILDMLVLCAEFLKLVQKF